MQSGGRLAEAPSGVCRKQDRAGTLCLRCRDRRVESLLGVEDILTDFVLVRDAGYGDGDDGARLLLLE